MTRLNLRITPTFKNTSSQIDPQSVKANIARYPYFSTTQFSRKAALIADLIAIVCDAGAERNWLRGSVIRRSTA
jgi:hypothetical protein